MSHGCQELFGVPPHWVDPKSGYRIWWVNPNGAVGELAPGATELDDATASFICDELWPRMQRRNRTGERYTFVHNWSQSRTYTKTARGRLLTFMMENHQHTANCGIVLSATNAFARVGALTAAAAIRLVGFDVRIAESPRELVNAWNLKLDAFSPVRPL